MSWLLLVKHVGLNKTALHVQCEINTRFYVHLHTLKLWHALKCLLKLYFMFIISASKLYVNATISIYYNHWFMKCEKQLRAALNRRRTKSTTIKYYIQLYTCI